MQYQYLIFDLDNTLYAKNTGMLKYIDQKIDQYMHGKLKLPIATVAEMRQRYCEAYGTTLGGLVIHHQIDPEEYIRQAYCIDIERFIHQDFRLKKMLDQLEGQKVVFSNSPVDYVTKVLTALGVRSCFAEIYDIGFCNYRGKPNPASFRMVAEDLKTQPEQCLLVDDVLANIVGAEQAGMDAVWLTETPIDRVKWWIPNIYALEPLLAEVTKDSFTA